MFGLGHLDLGPLFYGLVIFVGLWSMWAKLTSWRIGSFLAEAFVFYLVFKLHGGTLADDYADSCTRIESRQFMRQLIAHHMGGKPLQSRRVFIELQEL